MMGPGYGPGYNMMGGGAGLIASVFILAFGALIIAAIVVLVVWVIRQSTEHREPEEQPPAYGGMRGEGPGPVPMPGSPAIAPDEASAIARRRYASGEISREEYDEIMKTLGG